MSDELDALVTALYAAFDNRDGRVPDGDALRALFTDDATITRVADGEPDTWDAEGFVSPRIALLTGGALVDFHEWETESRTLVLEHIASRWSTYEKEGLLDGADYRGAGDKLLHFRRVAGEWRIASLLWEDR
jgi:hypothetical protein